VRYYGQFKNPQVDEYLYNTFFPKKNNGICIECGAYDGLLESSCKVFADLGWLTINVEADPDIFKKLIKNRQSKKDLNYNAILTCPELDGKFLSFSTVKFLPAMRHLINIYGEKTGAGTVTTNEIKFNRSGNSKFTFSAGEIDVIGMSYKSLIKDSEVTEVDLFVLDVEGEEENVILGMKECEILPKVMCIEILPTGLEKLRKLLKPFGYREHSIVHNNVHFILEKFQ